MKKLIVPFIAILTIFTSCEKDEIKTDNKENIKTASIVANVSESKGLTGKVVKTANEITLRDIEFMFKSDVYDYTKTANFANDSIKQFVINDIAIGSNNIEVRAKSPLNGENGKPRNNFEISYNANEVNNLNDFKLKLADFPKPYIKYSQSYFYYTINPNGNNMAIELHPYTSKISTAFRLSNNDIANGLTYTVEAYNFEGMTTEFFNDSSNLVAHFESADDLSHYGNYITYKIKLFKNGNFIKEYNVQEDFNTGKSINTLYLIGSNTIYKDTATITLSALPIEDIDTEKPID